ncbi:MAG TPA: ABC transporter permease [Nitrososphaerales archaeon]|nr:ABC transporter permease [Nitrososphaerales archaeon]
MDSQPDEGDARRGAGARVRDTLGLMTSNKESIIGFSIIMVFLVTAVVMEASALLNVQVTPYPANPLPNQASAILLPPSLAHPFGTDNLGRDVFSRILVATPYDFMIGFLVVGTAVIIGGLLGGLAGLRGGLLDEFLMRFTDIFFALPVLLIAMVIGAILGGGILNMSVALMITWWPPYARLARGESLKVAHQNYIEAARLSGQKAHRILIRHVLPNISGTMLIYATLDIGTVILVYSGLTFLGLGNKPPAPDWGQMVAAYNGWLLTDPWLAIIPGLVISMGVIGFSLLGDGVKDTLGIR